jgi:hypothetical protein
MLNFVETFCNAGEFLRHRLPQVYCCGLATPKDIEEKEAKQVDRNPKAHSFGRPTLLLHSL